MTPLSRRYFLRDCGLGLGKIAAAGLLTGALGSRAVAAPPKDPLAPKHPHFPGKAKAVIHLFMAGAPSQLELFDPKPTLSELEGKPLPKSVIGDQRYAFIQPDAGVLGPQFTFAQHGQFGCHAGLAAEAPRQGRRRHLPRALRPHGPVQPRAGTDFLQHRLLPAGAPCIGSWALYGLGAETQDLPAFVVMSTGSGLSGGSALWSSGFLPTTYTGVQFRGGKDPILNVSTPKGFGADLQGDTFDLVNDLNRQRLETIGVRPNSPPQTTRVSSSMPRRLRSATSAALAWSVLRQLPSTLPLTLEWASQPSW